MLAKRVGCDQQTVSQREMAKRANVSHTDGTRADAENRYERTKDKTDVHRIRKGRHVEECMSGLVHGCKIVFA